MEIVQFFSICILLFFYTLGFAADSNYWGYPWDISDLAIKVRVKRFLDDISAVSSVFVPI